MEGTTEPVFSNCEIRRGRAETGWTRNSSASADTVVARCETRLLGKKVSSGWSVVGLCAGMLAKINSMDGGLDYDWGRVRNWTEPVLGIAGPPTVTRLGVHKPMIGIQFLLSKNRTNVKCTVVWSLCNRDERLIDVWITDLSDIYNNFCP